MYPPNWPECPHCGCPVLDGHLTCGDASCCSEQIERLNDAVLSLEQYHPLPRCKHGKALRDHAGDRLELSCGCTAKSDE